MALEPTHVVVAGTGTVSVAPEGTALPTDLVTPLPAAYLDVGYITEDGVTLTFSRDTEDINAWQSAEPVRVLTTAEPKTIAFDLLEFDKTSVLLAFRGGAITGSAAPYIYTPPDPGASDVRVMVIEGKDGASTFRFVFPRVSLSGDVEMILVRTDALHPTLEFSVLASPTKWSIISDLVGFSAAGTLEAGSMPTSHADLDSLAEGLGYSWSRSDLTIAEKQEELTEAQAAPAAA